MICSSLFLQLFFKLKWQDQGRKEASLCKRHLPRCHQGRSTRMPFWQKLWGRSMMQLESKQFLWHSMTYHIEQCKKDFSWLNNNNIYYFRWAKLPTNSITVKQEAVVDDDEEQNGGGENNGQWKNNCDAAGKWQVCLCMHHVWRWSVLNFQEDWWFFYAFFPRDVISPK